jgi:Ca-activated chloride channel family protein
MWREDKMTDDLDKLSALKAPSPDAIRKAETIAQAMAAFDLAQNSRPATQGNPKPHRHGGIVTVIGSFIMNRKLLAGSALATLLVVPAAAYLTIGYLDRMPMPPVTDIKVNDELRKKETPADKPEPAAKNDAGVLKTEGGEAKPVAPVEEQMAADSVSPQREQDAEMTVAGRIAEVPEGVPAPKTLNMALPAAPATAQAPAEDMAMPSLTDGNRDRFVGKEVNPVKSVATDPVSTFSIDVDTASYAFARRELMYGQLPPADSVRVEEMINYFPYDWKGPDKPDEAFRTTVTVMPTPWNAGTKLMHVAIKGYDIAVTDQRPANLVFLIDVSGSMDAEDKLPLLRSAFRLLVNKLKPTDTVSIVTYAGNSGVVLEPTAVSDKTRILAAIDTLTPGGSTAGAAGIETAYALAEKAFVKDGVNRIFLATDGDFNVGASSDEELKRLIEEKRKTGIFLSVLGFGTGNYNDGLMQVLAQNGNGIAAYIDTLSEAQKTLVQEATASLFPIAKDVKIQVEFNPAAIAEYRLIGYETRALKREDFNNDKIDAGEIGSGHRVTAIYEVTPKGSPAVLNDDLRYQNEAKPDADKASNDEMAFVKIRYKKPNEDKSELITMPVKASSALPSLDDASADVRFSVAVSAFGQKLRSESQLDDYSWSNILALGEAGKGADPFGYRAEFLKLVQLAEGLKGK